MQCLIIDSDKIASKSLESFIHKTKGLEWIASCTKMETAAMLLQQHAISILFIDATCISEISNNKWLSSNTQIIITSPSNMQSEHLVLQKPYAYISFLNATFHAIEQRHNPSNTTPRIKDSLFINYNGLLQKILFRDILYIEALHNYMAIVTPQRKFITYASIKKVMDELPSTSFIRIHKSFIVPIHSLHTFQDNKLHIESKAIPVSRTLKKIVSSILMDKTQLSNIVSA
jgi:DNA-binding LytR/AlgR family response regulator